MPIYEYYCADCKDSFDARRPMSKADAAIQCKNCESVRTSRMLSLFAVGGSSTGSNTVAPPASKASRGGGGGCCGGACGCGH